MRNTERKPNIEILPNLRLEWNPEDKENPVKDLTEPIEKGYFIKWIKETDLVPTGSKMLNYGDILKGETSEIQQLKEVETHKALIEKESGYVVSVPYRSVRFIRNAE